MYVHTNLDTHAWGNRWRQQNKHTLMYIRKQKKRSKEQTEGGGGDRRDADRGRVAAAGDREIHRLRRGPIPVCETQRRIS